MMRAALMWMINDLPAYGILSGWSTPAELACLYYIKRSTHDYDTFGMRYAKQSIHLARGMLWPLFLILI